MPRPYKTMALSVVLAGCGALSIPPSETPYYVEQLALSRTATSRSAAPEAVVLREASDKLEVLAASEAERIRHGDETEGLLDVETPQAREFLAQLADPTKAEDLLATAPLDLERVLLAVHARNPDVAAARGNWAATVRMYEQATYLEDLLLRYSAFTRLATPRIGAAPMREAAFPYPGLVALKGEMIDREATMAREMTRMRLRDAMTAASKAYHGATHHEQELTIRVEQVELAKRAVEATRARVASGTSPQADLLEMESDLAMAESDRAHAETNVTRSRGELNTLLDRAPDAPLRLHQHGEPTPETPPLAAFLALARRFSPEIRVAQAEAARTAAAIRMAEAMLFAAPSPGAVAPGAPMGGATPVAANAGAAAPSGGMSGGAMASPSGATRRSTGLAPRDEAPSGAPGAFGPDAAWVAELRERHAALLHAAEESVRAVERRVVEGHYELDAARRMFETAAKSTEPLAAQAVAERMRLYETGRGDFAALTAALKRRLDAAHDVIVARHDYGMAEAMLWMAVGARPEAVQGAEALREHK